MLRELVHLSLLICFFNTAFPSPIDSIKLKIKSLPLAKQIDYIESLPFDVVVSNSREIIPFLHLYEKTATELGKFSSLAKIYINLSLAYYYSGKYDENTKYGLKAIQLYDSLGDNRNLGTMYGELGFQMKRRDLPKAFGYMQKGIKILEDLGQIEPLAKIYDNYGVLHEIDNQIDSALFFYRKALSFKKIMNDSLGIPYSLNNIFSVKLIKQEYDSALWYLNQSTRIRKMRADNIGLAENYSYYSQLHKSQKNYIQAIRFNNLALDLAKKHSYALLVQNMYYDLSECYENLNQLDKALAYHKLFKQFQDSLLNLETNRTIAGLQVQFETAEKEKELVEKNQQLERERNIKISISIIAVLVIFTIIIIFRNKLQITKRNEKIRVQNALIEGEQAERNRLALELHDGVANDLNAIILSLTQSTDNQEIIQRGIDKLKHTHQSIRKLSHSIMPRSLKNMGLATALHELAVNYSNDSFTITTQFNFCNQKFSEFIEFNLYRIIQEAINNTVKHAKAKNVLIDCNVIDNKLLVSIEDDGIGFDIEKIADKKGIGINNIENRVKMLNGIFHICSEKDKGTSIEIEVPIK